MNRTFLAALGLFAFIPLVLVLFLRQPLGPVISVLVGLALIAGHRRVAGPWVAQRGRQRCLWCGRSGPSAHSLEVHSSGRTWELAACRQQHANSAGRLLAHLHRYRVLIALGIFVPLSLLLGGTLLRSAGVWAVEHAWLSQTFRLVVASTVLLVSLTYFSSSPAAVHRSPFPIHNLCLLGLGKTLWVFRLVGAWWLVAAAMQWFGG